MNPASEGAATAGPAVADASWARLWRAPFPALLEAADGQLVDANPAFCELCGRSLQALVGRRVAELQPTDDVQFQALPHEAARTAVMGGQAVAPRERRFLDANGIQRWCRVWLEPGPSHDGMPTVLWWMQEITAERRAQVLVDRTLEELTQWFNLSPSGKVVFDASGLVLRSNPVFEALVGGVPISLNEAPPELQALLGWQEGGLRGDLQPGLPPVETEAEFATGEGQVTRLRAKLSSFVAGDGLRRVMAVVEDRSAEAERDLAQFEMGALMSAAGLGVATFDAQSARHLTVAGGDSDTAPVLPAGLHSINRQMVEPGSRAAYERLQQALRAGQSAEVRYAVQHPELGQRWLLTRVEPARLRTGRQATSVVTLDVTEQEIARQHGEELLRELTTTLDASPVGIAYLREGRLLRCNRRFERMLGFEPGEVAGAWFEELFALRGSGHAGVQTAKLAVEASRPCDVELDIGVIDGQPTWYALSVRRAESAHVGAEAVAVLTDISSLKLQQAEIERTLHERELMFNQSDVGMAWVRAGRILRANRAMTDLTGWPAAELVGLQIASLYEDADRAMAEELAARRALVAHGRHNTELRLRHRDGSLRWAQVTMRAVHMDDPDTDLICSFVDVDERWRARESLQLLAGRTRAVLDSVLVGIVTADERGIEWMNRSARRMFAGELVDFAGKPMGTVATEEPDHPLNRTDWLQRLADGESESFECRLKARDGREFWVVGNAVATPRAASAGRQLTFALLDIEARRQAEVRILAARASLQRLIETAPLAIALFDADSWSVVECNQASEAFFGKTADQLRGAAADDCFADGQEAAALKASLALARETPEGVRREITRPEPNGSTAQRWDTRFVHLQVPGSAAGSTSRGQVLLVANDVTELRRAEQARLDAAIAQREMLVKEVHHRIKNNLQGVAGLLQQTAQRRPEVRNELGEAIGQVQAIAQVYGLQVGNHGPLDLVGVLGAIAGSVQRSSQRVIEVHLASQQMPRWTLPEAESIPLALTLNELLTNAVKHGAQGPVRCSVLSREGDVRIEIVNSGCLPEGFDLQRTPSGMYGLGLVRSLLPRRAASLDLTARDGQVVTALTLRPPSIRRVVH